MTEAEYVEQQILLGRRIHAHDGVFWEQTYPLYCKPVFEFRVIKPQSAKPGLRHSVLGYSHQVSDPSMGNRSLSFMVLEEGEIEGYDMSRLNAKKRNQIRKGMKHCEVQRITEVEPLLEAMREMNISQAKRQGRIDVPPEYYIEKADEWRKEIRATFAHTGYQWWGAFCGNELAAYMAILKVEGVVFIQVVKSHTAYLNQCPTDALYYVVLAGLGQDAYCNLIVNGGPGNQSLDHFKEQYLFKPKPYSYYTYNDKLFNIVKYSGGKVSLYISKTRAFLR